MALAHDTLARSGRAQQQTRTANASREAADSKSGGEEQRKRHAEKEEPAEDGVDHVVSLGTAQLSPKRP